VSAAIARSASPFVTWYSMTFTVKLNLKFNARMSEGICSHPVTVYQYFRISFLRSHAVRNVLNMVPFLNGYEAMDI
jgi:hypothetical protein